MSYRLLLDENIEYEVKHRLRNYGHDVEHVDFVSELGKGTEDRSIGEYSLRTGRIIVTYDDDFVLDIHTDEYEAVLYIGEASLSADEIADIIHEMSRHYDQQQIVGIEYVSPEWL